MISATPRSTAVAAVILSVLVVSGMGIGVAVAQQVPGDPANYYGGVDDENGTPAPVGTTIVAVVDGTAEDQISVDPAGEYGGGGAFDDKITIDSSLGDQVSFHVGSATGPEAIESPVALESGTTEQDLTFPDGTFTSNFAVSSISAPSSVTEGDTIDVSATVENTGEFSNEQTQDVTLDIPGVGAASQSITLTGGESQDRTLSVGTGSGDSGTYDATVQTNDDNASQSITINEPAPEPDPEPDPDPANFGVSIQSTNSPVTTGNQLEVTATVENTGGQIGEQSITFSVNGSQLDSESISLGAGNSQEIDFTYDTTNSDKPAVDVTVASGDDSASSTVSVADPSFFDVTTLDAPATVTTGNTVDLSATIENTGGQSGEQSITFSVGGSEVSSESVSLAAEATQEVDFSYPTTANDKPEIDIAVATADTSENSTVSVADPASFEVTSFAAPDTVTTGDTIDVSAVIENIGGQSDNQSISFSVDGSEAGSEAVSLAAGATQEVDFSYTTTTDDTPSIDVAIDSDDDSVNSTVSVANQSFFAVRNLNTVETVTTGDTVGASATIENTGGQSGGQSITFSINGSELESESVSLAAGATQKVNFSYPTSPDDKPAVDVAISSSDDSASSTVSVVDAVSFDVTSFTAPDTVTTGDTVEASATIENTGGQGGEQSITFSVNGSESNSESVTLAAGATQKVNFSYPTSPDDKPAVDVAISSSDDSASSTVSVVDPASFDVTSFTTPDTVTTGNTVDISATIENTGGQSGEQSITFSVNGSESDSESVTLAAGATQEVNFSYRTDSDDKPAVDLAITSSDDSASDTVSVADPAFFEVTTVDAPETVKTGNTTDVSATIENIGGQSGDQSISFLIDGTEEASEDVSLAAGENTTETFSYSVSQGLTAQSIDAAIKTQNSTNSTNIKVNNTLNRTQLTLDANRTTVIRGEAIEFTVTDDTETPVNATVSVGDTTRQTGSDGIVVILTDTAGKFDAVATKTPTIQNEFAPDSLLLTVERPTVDIEPETISFDNTTLETSATTELTLSNNAPSAVSIDSLQVRGSDADAFTIDAGNLSDEITTGTEETLNITFEPQSRETTQANLTVNDQAVPLSGTGVAPTVNVDTALPIELASKPNPDTPVTTPVTISNDGNTQLTANLSTGDRFSQPDTLTVDAGASETFDISFTPQDEDSATVNTRLTITPDSEALSPTSVPVSGTVIDRDITIQTNEVNFGNITVDETASAGVVVTNPGTTTETLTPTTNKSAFTVEDGEFTLAPGEQNLITVEADLSESGPEVGTLTVANGSIVNDTATLSATAEAPQVNITSSEPLSFGTTSLNSTTTEAVEITNDGQAQLSVNIDSLADSEFSPVGDSQVEIPAGESRSIPIGFTPQTAGESTATLTLSTNDPETPKRPISLTAEGIETSLQLSPTTASFGTVGVSNSTTQTVTLENDGSAFTINDVTVDGTAFESSSDLSGTTISEDGSVTLDVVFAPETSGSQTGTVTVSGSTDTESTNLSAALTGSGQTAELQVSSQTLRTGVTTADETTSGLITIENTGLAGTQLTIDELTINDTAQFEFGSNSISEGTTIAGGTEEPIAVTFDPASPEDGTEETTLSLNASSGDTTFTRTITLTGTISAPEPTVSTEELAVGTVPVDTSTARTFTISNDGGEPFSINSVEADATGVTAQQLGSSEAVPGAERTVIVEVTPAAAGSINSDINIATTANDLSVAVTGDAVAPEFSVETGSVDFGNTPTGSADQRSVTIENNGDAPLTVASPTINGPDGNTFSIVAGDERLRIPSESSETITLSFAPDNLGGQSATLSADPVNDPTVDSATQIALSGTGTESDVELSNASVGFGSLEPDSTQTQSLQLTNEGGAETEITGSSVIGSDSNAFSVNGLPQQILQPGETETFDVVVDSAGLDRGRITAQVDIRTTDETVSSSVGATVTSPEIEVSGAADVDAFGTTRLGETSTASLQVVNTGNADLNVTDIDTTGEDAAAFSIVDQLETSISSQSSDRVVIEFTPEALQNSTSRAQNTPLEADATLEVDHNAGSTETVRLTGEAETTALAVPRTLQFGDTPIGETTTQEVTIENKPSATTGLNITGVALSGRNTGEYEATLTEGGSPISLAPGEETTVNVSLTPDTFDRKFATLSVQTTDPRQPVQKVGISNTQTVYIVDYGSVDVQYLNPTAGQEPTVDVDRGLRGQNATLTSTTANVNTTSNYGLNYTFGATASDVGNQNALQNGTAVRYINATTDAPSNNFSSTFQIEVSKAVIASQNATPDNITIYHEDGSDYEPLETTRLFETTQGHVYEVTTDSYSVFAVGVEATSPDDGNDGDENDGDETEDGNNDNTGSSGGSSTGGASDTESADDTSLPTVQDVRDTLNLIQPTTDTVTEIEDNDPDTPGNSITPEGTNTVRRITFDNDELAGSVSIREYNNPPEQVTTEVVTSVANDVEGIDSQPADGEETDTSSNIDVVSVNDITVDTDNDGTSATVELAVSKDRVDNPQQVTIVKEFYDFEAQTDRWKQLETDVVENAEDEVVIEAQVDEFSMFAVIESEQPDEQQQVDDGSDDSPDGSDAPTDEGGTGPMTVIGILALIAILGAAVYIYNKQEE